VIRYYELPKELKNSPNQQLQWIGNKYLSSCTRVIIWLFYLKYICESIFWNLKVCKLLKSFIKKFSNVCMVYLVLKDRDCKH